MVDEGWVRGFTREWEPNGPVSPEPWIRQIQPLTSALCTMAVLVLEEHGGVCSHWQAVTSKEEEGQSKAKYPLQFILFKFTTRGSKECVCICWGERRDGAAIERGWITETTQDSTGSPELTQGDFHKGKGERTQDEDSRGNHRRFKNFQTESLGVLSQLYRCARGFRLHITEIWVNRHLFRVAQACVYQGGCFIPYWSCG